MRNHHHRLSALEEVITGLQPENIKTIRECVLNIDYLPPLPESDLGGLCEALIYV
jgi:hypothetical protein